MCICTHVLHNVETRVGQNRLGQQWMPRAKEISPLAILRTRATHSAAQVSKKVKDFIQCLSLPQCQCSQTFNTDFHCSHNTSRGRMPFTPANEARSSNVPFSPHGTRSCISTPKLRKIPEERRSSTPTTAGRWYCGVKSLFRASLQ